MGLGCCLHVDRASRRWSGKSDLSPSPRWIRADPPASVRYCSHSKRPTSMRNPQPVGVTPFRLRTLRCGCTRFTTVAIKEARLRFRRPETGTADRPTPGHAAIRLEVRWASSAKMATDWAPRTRLGRSEISAMMTATWTLEAKTRVGLALRDRERKASGAACCSTKRRKRKKKREERGTAQNPRKTLQSTLR